MRQRTLAEEGLERFSKPMRRQKLVDEMQQVVPRSGACALIEPFLPKEGGRGRPSIGVERILRIPLLQHWFNLSDAPVDETLYNSRRYETEALPKMPIDSPSSAPL